MILIALSKPCRGLWLHGETPNSPKSLCRKGCLKCLPGHRVSTYRLTWHSRWNKKIPVLPLTTLGAVGHRQHHKFFLLRVSFSFTSETKVATTCNTLKQSYPSTKKQTRPFLSCYYDCITARLRAYLKLPGVPVQTVRPHQISVTRKADMLPTSR